MAKQRLALSDVKVGDKVIFNDGKEKLTLTITHLDAKKGEIDVKWKTRETWLLKSDFSNGFVFKK